MAVSIDPWTYVYYNTMLQRKTNDPVQYKGNHSTDVIRDRGIEYLNAAHKAGKPFFIGIAPIGPHTQTHEPPKHPVPAKRHEGLFKDVNIKNYGNFNPAEVSNLQSLQTSC